MKTLVSELSIVGRVRLLGFEATETMAVEIVCYDRWRHPSIPDLHSFIYSFDLLPCMQMTSLLKHFLT